MFKIHSIASVILFVLFASLIMGCENLTRSNIENNESDIHQRLHLQQQCWNNGNLEGFMQVYWKSDSLCFLSKNGMSCGWKNVFNNYKKSYNSSDKMGKLDFKILKSEPMNDSTHFLVGRWQVSRTHDTLGGSFNLIWRKIKGEWYIVFDHTS